MNVVAMSSVTSTAMQGLNKAEATVTEVAQSVASGNAQTSEGSQIIAGADASLTEASSLWPWPNWLRGQCRDHQNRRRHVPDAARIRSEKHRSQNRASGGRHREAPIDTGERKGIFEPISSR